MNAIAALKELAERYEGLRSYADRGRVTLRFRNSDDAKIVEFLTLFQRPDSFRFEWTTHHPYPPLKHIVTHRILSSHDGITTLSDSRKDADEKEESLMAGIAGATGVSHGAALTVAKLLMPGLDAFSLLSLGSQGAMEIVLEGKPSWWIKV